MGNDELGRLVRAARQRRKWSILYTADVCNVSKTQLQLIETARTDQSPKLRTIESLIKGLELSALTTHASPSRKKDSWTSIAH